MSSSKDCEDHCRRKFYRRLFACFLAFIILVLFVILLIWLILRPTKPRFYLRDTSVLNFNLTDPSHLTTSFQVTISSTNPNDRIGIYYTKLDAYVEYKNQQITIPTGIPVGYQGHNDVTVWSPFIYGTDIPIAWYLSNEVAQDENAGVVLLHVKVDGRLRWKVGSWTSGHYHIYVNCPAFMSVKGGGSNGGGVFKFQQMTTCSVDV